MNNDLETKAPLPTTEVGADGNKLKQEYADFLQANEKTGKKLENPLETFLLKAALAKEGIKANPNYESYLKLSVADRKKVDASINQLRGEIRAAEGVPDIKIESPEEIEARAKKVREAYAKKLAEEKKAVEEKAKADAAKLAAETKPAQPAVTPGEAATSVDQQQKAESGLSAEEAAKQIAETQAKFTNLRDLGKPDSVGKPVDLGFGVDLGKKPEAKPFTLLTPEFQQKSEAELRAKLEAAAAKPAVVDTERVRDTAIRSNDKSAAAPVVDTERIRDEALKSGEQPKAAVVDTERVRDEALKSDEQPQFTAQQSVEKFEINLAPGSQNRKTPAEAFLEKAPVPTTPEAKPSLFTKIFGGLMNSLKPKPQPEAASQAAPAAPAELPADAKSQSLDVKAGKLQ